VQVHLTEQTAPCPTLVLPINSPVNLAQKPVATVAVAL
jgi:hypothetical protein